MKISLGNSRMDKHWKNTEMAWQELCDHVKVTKRTDETLEQFATLPKGQQDTVKDVGGFVGGHIKDGRRKKGNILCRSLLALDMDYATPDVWAEITMFQDFQCCIYTTHKHTPENPRLRLLIPLSRDVTEDEYGAVGRMVAKEIGIDLFDDTTYEAARLMYWPSTSSDGEFLFEEVSGSLLDPDVILGKYDDWKDVSAWPVSSRQNKIISHELKKQADPLAKEGVVGAFCRTFSVQEAIDQFLEGVYSPSAKEGRYDYDLADSAAGVVVYEDKFIYSHHASDPASGRLLNAFDVVRVHKFEGDDEKKSFQEMCDFAMGLDAVKHTDLEERRTLAAMEFEEGEDWQAKLRYNKKGNSLENSVWNLMLILNNDPAFENIAFNELVGRVEITGDVPWIRPPDNHFWRDADTAQMKVHIDIHYATFSSRNHDVAFTKMVEDRRFHPLREWLDSLPEWDGVTRLENLYIDFLGANNTSYVKAATRKSFVAAVARIYEPGIKFDSVTVLVGPQGCGKSTIFAKMGGAYYSDSLCLTDMKDKASAEKLQGYWLLELGELAGLKKTDIEVVKAFLSRTDDIYRPSYGRTIESHPRQCILVGTTNSETGFLRDITGNRRFWPVKVTGDSPRKSWDITEPEREQMWAEAIHLYREKEPLYLSVEESSEALEEQIEAMETDDRQGMVEVYLDTPLPENWDTLSIYERRNYLSGDNFEASDPVKTHLRDSVCNMEIWVECFGKDGPSMKSSDSYAIAALMKKVRGWDRSPVGTSDRKHFPIYGRQRAYLRKETEEEIT